MNNDKAARVGWILIRAGQGFVAGILFGVLILGVVSYLSMVTGDFVVDSTGFTAPALAFVIGATFFGAVFGAIKELHPEIPSETTSYHRS